jgi:DNA-binding NarL/FixJ family response regulator
MSSNKPISREKIVKIVKEALKKAALHYECKQSEALNPSPQKPHTIKARDLAIRIAYSKGVSKYDLAEAFQRNERTIRNCIR